MSAEGPKPKIPRVTVHCCVPQCNQYAEQGISFHHFPADREMKKQWEAKLKMGKPSTMSMRVCSRHFSPSDYFPSGNARKKLFPHAVPSQNLPRGSADRVVSEKLSHQRESRKRRAQHREEQRASKEKENPIDQNELLGNEVNNNINVVHVEEMVKGLVSVSVQVNLMDMRKNREYAGVSFADILSDMIALDKCTQVNNLPQWKIEDPCPQVTLPQLLTSKEKLYTFTGLHSPELLDTLVECVSELAVDACTKKKMLPVRDRVILTMLKIKQNMDFTAIGVLFGINRQTCSNYFKNICPLISTVLKSVIPWPDQSIIRCNLPLSFKKFKATRIVLDCCEVSIEKCKCLKCRVLTWSQYKKDHTIKFNMGIAPSGLIIECSPAFGGRASDKLVVAVSKILDKLDCRDGVMVDKGYQIEKECLERNLTLIRPPFLSKSKNNQLSREDAVYSAEIARARVHVERVFQRMRDYDMLVGPVPWELVPYFEDCLTIVMGLTNLGPPIMNIDKFM